MRLFEFGDQPWLPRVLRDGETAYLAMAYRLLPLARAWADRIIASVQPHHCVTILDLCSGAGGPLEQIIEEFTARGYRVSVTMSDMYPFGRSRRHPAIHWHPDPVDARKIPAELAGIRTMFSAFHHFDWEAAHAILENAFRCRSPICIFEAGAGNLLGVASMLLVPLNVLALMPFVRPFRWAYLILTYLIPVLPLMILWDGFVSMLRIYSTDQMRQMVSGLKASDYVWEIGALRVQRIPGALPYVIGRPVIPG
ncbi:MAG: hypothetical protein JO022_10570 [Acidobacteriaceae bacterium]|nr:hypothetical protein [Acidobacteriaceae bacterium]